MRTKTLLTVVAIIAFSALLIVHTMNLTVSAQRDVPDKHKTAARDEVPLNKWEEKIQVEIAPVGDNLEPTEKAFTSAENVIIGVFMTNVNTEDAIIGVGDPHVQSRPFLKKDGQPVLYKQKVAKRLQLLDKHGQFSTGPLRSVAIKASERARARIIVLSDWYEQLVPGQYELTMKYRFSWKKKPIKTNTIFFEVMPQS